MNTAVAVVRSAASQREASIASSIITVCEVAFVLIIFFYCGPYRCLRRFFTRKLGRWFKLYFYGLHSAAILVLLTQPGTHVRVCLMYGEVWGVLVFFGLAGTMFWSYAWLQRTLPGYVTAPVAHAMPASMLMPAPPDGHSEHPDVEPTTDETVNDLRCEPCGGLPRLMRSRHCHICGHCIATYDHHCVWIGRCVGEKNHMHFLVFLAIEVLGLCWGMFEAWYGIHARADVTDWVVDNAVLLVMLVGIGVIVVGPIGLLCWHSYLMLTNQTTYETFKGRALSYYVGLPPDTSPYDWGVRRNIALWVQASFTMPPDMLMRWTLNPSPQVAFSGFRHLYDYCCNESGPSTQAEMRERRPLVTNATFVHVRERGGSDGTVTGDPGFDDGDADGTGATLA